MKKFVIPSVFTAVDKLSGPVSKMGKSVQDFATESQDAVARSNRRFRKLGDTAFDVAGKSALIGTAIIAPLGLAAKAAIDFEDKMADVAKVANVALGSDQFKKMGDQAMALGVALGVPAEEAAGLMANLAQGGVALEDLDRIALMAGKVGVAFGVSADLAGESFIKTQNALGGTIEQTEKLMDTINFLGNTTAASSANLLTFMASGGSGVARAVGDSGQAVAAMGAQLIAMGKSAEESATILERFTKNTLKTDSLRAVFDNAGGGAAGMLAVIEKGTKLAAKEQDAYFQQFGEYGISLQLLGKNFDSLSKNVQAATNEQLINNSVLDEFANRSNTTAFKLAQMRTQVQNVAVKVGSALLPIIVKLTDKITPIIMRITDWISRNRELVEMIVKFVAILGALSFAISGVAFIIGVYSKAVLIVNTITKAWAAAQTILNLILIANPIGIVIALVGLLAAAIAWVVLHTEGWGETWGSVMDFMENYIKMWYYTVESIFLGIEHSFLTMVDNIVLAWKWGQNAIGLLSDEQYAKDKARIEAEKKARISALQESIAARTAATGEVMKGIDWQVKWKGEDAPAINQPKSDMDSQTEKIISGQMKSSVDLNLNDPRLSVANVSPNVNVRTSSTK